MTAIHIVQTKRKLACPHCTPYMTKVFEFGENRVMLLTLPPLLTQVSSLFSRFFCSVTCTCYLFAFTQVTKNRTWAKCPLSYA